MKLVGLFSALENSFLLFWLPFAAAVVTAEYVLHHSYFAVV